MENTNLVDMKIDFKQYLFSQLWACKDENFAELPYDQQWDEIPARWRDFEKSKFNNPEQPLYDCILAYFDADES